LAAQPRVLGVTAIISPGQIVTGTASETTQVHRRRKAQSPKDFPWARPPAGAWTADGDGPIAPVSIGAEPSDPGLRAISPRSRTVRTADILVGSGAEDSDPGMRPTCPRSQCSGLRPDRGVQLRAPRASPSFRRSTATRPEGPGPPTFLSASEWRIPHRPRPDAGYKPAVQVERTADIPVGNRPRGGRDVRGPGALGPGCSGLRPDRGVQLRAPRASPRFRRSTATRPEGPGPPTAMGPSHLSAVRTSKKWTG